ncbi:toll/interleukin-1 receptor domain-containing protein [Pseudoalteromonas sp. SWXJZ94C]|uniref:TIR domain-containing protein n=1 Tax=Pseudoalteromonas sp. SWXJZ94C TaxID=2792065 RepID=UPI0018CD07C3|nr:TIR domain-containing protein [Pseudoalteromonas sp. SWXJZ94C]MBH0056589.1 toll/interleukin-1 receptor domain-containing protein [Pseudoalteromonas sp. SWXJZ94C]
MKVFLSWSGDTSHKVALILRDWLPSVIQSIEPYVSSEDIDKGARWSTDIASELEDSTYGILCVTKENLRAPWLIFEAGALSKTMDKSSVSPFLFDIKRVEVNGPILQFQSTVFEKEDVKKLLLSLNKACNDDQLTSERLDKAFDVWYPTLEEQLNELPKSVLEPAKVVKKKDEASNAILEEILNLSRDNQKLLRSGDSESFNNLESLQMLLKKLIHTTEFDKSSRSSKKRRKIHPMMIEELMHVSPRFEKNLTGFQITLSMFRDDYPWLYDSGIDLVRTLKNDNNSFEKRESVEAFFELINFTFEHPIMREMNLGDKEMMMMGRELHHILERSLDRYI